MAVRRKVIQPGAIRLHPFVAVESRENCEASARIPGAPRSGNRPGAPNIVLVIIDERSTGAAVPPHFLIFANNESAANLERLCQSIYRGADRDTSASAIHDADASRRLEQQALTDARE